MNFEKNPFTVVQKSQWGSAKVAQNEYSYFVCISALPNFTSGGGD